MGKWRLRNELFALVLLLQHKTTLKAKKVLNKKSLIEHFRPFWFLLYNEFRKTKFKGRSFNLTKNSRAFFSITLLIKLRNKTGLRSNKVIDENWSWLFPSKFFYLFANRIKIMFTFCTCKIFIVQKTEKTVVCLFAQNVPNFLLEHLTN